MINWFDKSKCLKECNFKTNKKFELIEDLSILPSNNLIIEGDNIDGLKLLLKEYSNKIRFIYIDPPYNTLKERIYNDSFVDGYHEFRNKFKEKYNRYPDKNEVNQRKHYKYLSFIYPRLFVSRELLSDNGIIFISINENELFNLKLLCDEIFNENNFIGLFSWRCSTGGIPPKFIQKNYEYVLCYAKNINKSEHFRDYVRQTALKEYNKKDDVDIYKLKRLAFRTNKIRKNAQFPIKCPDGEIVIPPEDYIYRCIEPTFLKWLEEDKIVFKRTNTSPLKTIDGKQAKWNIYAKIRLTEAILKPINVIPEEFVNTYFTSYTENTKIYGDKIIFFRTKPTSLMKYLMYISNVKENDIILDYFAGSLSTVQAVVEYSLDTDINLNFIMIQSNEKLDSNSFSYKKGYRCMMEIALRRLHYIKENIYPELNYKYYKIM